MPVKAIIADLDNTIYPASSITEPLFKDLFELLASELDTDTFSSAKEAISRKPFQWVATKYGFSQSLTDRSNAILNQLSWEEKMATFPDYHFLKFLPADKYLVTTGYTRLQESKIRNLGIANDFSEIHIVDPNRSSKVKKDIFMDILDRKSYHPSEVLVVGDDPDSEIKAGKELGMVTVLYDPGKMHEQGIADKVIRSFEELLI